MVNNAHARPGASDRRRAGLFKKAKELSILCGCEIGMIIFETTGELFQYSNVSMDELISKYTRGVERKAMLKAPVESSSTSGRRIATEEPNLSNEKLADKSQTTSARPAATEELDLLNAKQERTLVEIFTEQVKKIKSRQRPLCKEDEDCVQKLLEMIEEFLVLIRDRKEELLNQNQQQSRLQAEQYVQENEALNEPAMNLLDLFSPTSSPSVPFYVELGLMQRQNSSSTNSNSDIFFNFEADEDDSDTTLQLGLPYRVDRKRKEPEKETQFRPLT